MKSAIASLAFAAVADASVHVRPDLSLGWKSNQVDLAKRDVSFLMALKPTNMDQLREVVRQVSDPRSQNYTKYLSVEEIAEMTRPSNADIELIKSWLSDAGLESEVVHSGAAVRATGTVSNAEKLLNTKFEVLSNHRTSQALVRATDYELPADVEDAVSSVFGLHGLPLPAKKALRAGPTAPADVTPDVILQTYSVSGVKPSGSVTNRQAVAEFQGQTEKDEDLADFFKAYVKSAQAGDEKVYAFEGDKNKENPQVEASLDIQYIMGVAPHVKSEFWLYLGNDFCADLVEWTGALLADNKGPNVHSISYGWQGNLTQVQCTDAKVNTIDANFAKLAANGVSIIFASGDSGSGYSPGNTCQSAERPNDQGYTGTVERTLEAPEAIICCEEAVGKPFDFAPKSGPSPGATCSGSDIGTKGIAYSGTKHEQFHIPPQEKQLCCELARNTGGLYFTYEETSATEATCTLFTDVSGNSSKTGALSGKAAAGNQAGTCNIYSSVTGTKHVKGGTSGGNGPSAPVVLWPSWPASSPYVTSVGATRFVGQKVGNEEMATDQFGSGGGFSKQFDQTHAQWQAKDVAHYVNNPPNDAHYPPKGSFPPTGRATPDVSALGEGYQVVINGKPEAVGGTSASTPAFAGLVSLLNEAREQQGKKPLGFLNPFLYQNADAFTDVTKGTNAIGRGTGPIKYGYNATAGWDPATGLGTPKFGELLKAALALP